jgi:RND family efflux transporter MFP subunit
VATAQSALLSAEERFRGAESALAIAENELALKRAGVLPEAIAAQEARVRALQAGADALRAQINKTVLRSPIAGVVTKNDLRAGETVAPNVPLVRIQADTDYQIEANIPEVDIAKVSIGDEARVTLDAFGSDTVFQAKVSQVDPAETVIEGVPTYKVTLRFVSGEEVVKTGMTANIDIRTDERDAVVVIPSRAVGTEDGSKIVRILPPGAVTPTERVVTLGLRGSDGRVEVLTGVDVGDRIVTFDPGE